MEISRALLRTKAILVSLLAVLLFSARAQGQIGAMVPNWTVPSVGSSTSSTTPAHARALGDVTIPMSFVGVTPCRIVDTRGPTGPYGAPSLTAGVSRNFALASGPCTGIPASVGALSLNITVTNTAGPGFIKIYPQGASPPVVSTLNYVAGQTIANAAIVPAGSGGAVTVVAGVSGTDLIIDVNGYFPYGFINSGEGFAILGTFAGGSVIYGENGSNANESAGVRGVEDAAGSHVSGVLGEVGNLGFLGSFVHGSQGVTGINAFSGTLGIAMDRAVVGVLLDSAGSDLAEGWAGKSGASATNFFGIEGVLFSTTGGFSSAGVRGVDQSGYFPVPVLFTQAGVLGDSKFSYGVLGRSRFAGVYGALLDTTDAGVAAFGLLGTTFGQAADLTTGPWAVFAGGNFGATGTKHFVEPHPSDPGKVILYSSLEGRTVDTYFRGSGQFVGHEAVIDVPEDFRIVTAEDGLTVQLTPVGGFAQIYVESQDLNRIVVKSSRDVQFHYLIQGLRRAYKDVQPVETGYEFMPRSPSDTLPLYLSEEARRRLISNGTYNADGTVNMQTAERVGWTRIWKQREEESRAAAAVNAARSSDMSGK